MAPLSKNAQVLKFFAQRCKGVGTTQLQKFAYLADVEARRLLGRPVTDFDYFWHHYGPFDSSLYGAIDELVGAGHARQGEIDYGMAVKKTVTDSGHPAVFEFSPAELEILEYVASTYSQTPLNDLLYEVVYETEPMKAVKTKGERLPMEIVDNTQRNSIGFDLEEVIAAECAAKAGNFVLASDFFNGLRASFSTASAA
jgi:uncharacterized protein YwgA